MVVTIVFTSPSNHRGRLLVISCSPPLEAGIGHGVMVQTQTQTQTHFCVLFVLFTEQCNGTHWLLEDLGSLTLLFDTGDNGTDSDADAVDTAPRNRVEGMLDDASNMQVDGAQIFPKYCH